jgi:hypothetical protein
MHQFLFHPQQDDSITTVQGSTSSIYELCLCVWLDQAGNSMFL